MESSNVPIRYAPAPTASDSARWLAGRPGAVVVLPLGEGDTAAMLDGTAHWRPLVNGDSGFMPRPYTREMELLTAPAGEEPMRLLRALDVRHVVSRESLPLPVAVAFADERVYEVPSGPVAAVPLPVEAVPTVWTAAGVIASPAERTNSRLESRQGLSAFSMPGYSASAMARFASRVLTVVAQFWAYPAER